MNTAIKNVLLNDIYVLKEGISQQQLSSAVNRCLCQAEALTMVAAIADTEIVGIDTIHHYFWALSDIIHETKWLYDHLISRY